MKKTFTSFSFLAQLIKKRIFELFLKIILEANCEHSRVKQLWVPESSVGNRRIRLKEDEVDGDYDGSRVLTSAVG